MEVKIAPETRAALEANLTLRCLYMAKFHLDSRHSKVVIPWAQSLAERFSSAMLETIGQQTADVSIQLNMIQLLRTRKIALISYDLFLKECDKRVRDEIDRSLKQPVHEISQRGNVYYMRRNEKVDARVAAGGRVRVDWVRGIRARREQARRRRARKGLVRRRYGGRIRRGRVRRQQGRRGGREPSKAGRVIRTAGFNVHDDAAYGSVAQLLSALGT